MAADCARAGRRLVAMSLRGRVAIDGPSPLGVTDPAAAAAIAAYVRRAAQAIERHETLLDRLDVALGDGDHGANMAIGMRSVVRALDEPPTGVRPADIGELLRQVGHDLVASVGGASGPLYGTAFIEAGFFLGDADWIDTRSVADAFDVAAAALARRGRCAVGDKTILDALAPAARAMRQAADRGDTLDRALRAAAAAAAVGMRSTIPLVARRGLALRLGERSRGHRDPGATSCFLLVRAMVAERPPQPSP